MNSRKMIYVHLHKCGGTSVEVVLSNHCKWNDVLIGSTFLGELMQWQYFGQFGLHKHSSAKEIKAVVGEEIWSEYFTWATVRNPYLRLASLWGYIASLITQHAQEVGFPLGKPVAEWEEWALRVDYPQSEPWSYPGVKAYLAVCNASQPFSAFVRHPDLKKEAAFQPQWWGLQDEAGERLAVNKVARLEEIGTEWPGLCARLSFPDLPFAHERKTEAQFKIAPSDLLKDPEDAGFVRERFGEDFERFGYDPDAIP